MTTTTTCAALFHVVALASYRHPGFSHGAHTHNTPAVKRGWRVAWAAVGGEKEDSLNSLTFYYVNANVGAMKTCTKCKQDKDEALFYRNKGKPMSQCRACMNTYAVAYQRGKGHAKRLRFSHEWRVRNQDKMRIMKHASNQVFKALNAGLLVRATVCEQCARDGVKIEAAHVDYTKPLLVRWLCRSCHRVWDSNDAKCKGNEIKLKPKKQRRWWRKPVPEAVLAPLTDSLTPASLTH